MLFRTSTIFTYSWQLNINVQTINNAHACKELLNYSNLLLKINNEYKQRMCKTTLDKKGNDSKRKEFLSKLLYKVSPTKLKSISSLESIVPKKPTYSSPGYLAIGVLFRSSQNIESIIA